jgi:hypothetical protein
VDEGTTPNCLRTVRRTPVGPANWAEEGRGLSGRRGRAAFRDRNRAGEGVWRGGKGLQTTTCDTGIVNFGGREEGKSSKRVATGREEKSRFSVGQAL